MEMVTAMGLLCSHEKLECRPKIRQIMRYLNWDEPITIRDTWSSLEYLNVVMR